MIILKRPIISEKSMKLAMLGLFTFEVDKAATKPQIAKIVAEKFSVKVVSVKTMNVVGKIKVQRNNKGSFKTSPIKKAIVKLEKGQKIAMFETPKEDVVVTTAETEPRMLREKKDLLGRTKVKVEQSAVGASPTTQRKVITGK